MPRLSLACVIALTMMMPLSVLANDAVVATALQKLDASVFKGEERDRGSRLIGEYYSAQIKAGNAKSTAEWENIKSPAEWEQYRDAKLTKLKASLGSFPEPPQKLVSHVTREISGDGFVIKCIVYESRPGIWVSGNLYAPTPSRESMPGLIISHSHHTSKTNGELQDMGMTWARMGCLVLVPDHMGHGERRQHPFSTERDFAGSFRVSRQDYYFRYDLAVQAHLAGESFVGQLVWDLSRGVDLLLSQPGIDPKRIALLGAVAGGGDPAAVTAALDQRIQVAVPFNFGGPQPETTYPLPANAAMSFNYAGSGSWESTRNLKRSIADGFLPWVIVGGIAPRQLVYGHEFAWDQDHDPVWKRLQTIYDWTGNATGLSESHGYGSVKQADGSHCTHIGKLHRVAIHAALSKWFQLPDGAAAEYSQRRDSSELLCWNDEWRQRLKPREWRTVLNEKVTSQLTPLRRRAATPSLDVIRQRARSAWAPLLFGANDVTDVATGNQQPQSSNEAASTTIEKLGTADELAEIQVERFSVISEANWRVPCLLLRPSNHTESKSPVVLVLAQSGKSGVLKKRHAEIARLVKAGATVCLLDPRGIGETSTGNDRDRGCEMTSRSSTHLMLGGTLIGAQFRDVQAVLTHLSRRTDLDLKRLSVWGDSTAGVNAADQQLVVPHAIDRRPQVVEPAGQLLALLIGLFDDRVKSVLTSGGLISFQSVLERPTVHVPHDVVIPNMLTVGDISDLTQLLPTGSVKSVEVRTSGNQMLSGSQDDVSKGIDWLLSRLSR